MCLPLDSAYKHETRLFAAVPPLRKVSWTKRFAAGERSVGRRVGAIVAAVAINASVGAS
jgi:hypothetical protein